MRELVEVEWLDAQDHHETWVEAKDAEDFTDKDCKVKSMGYLVKKTTKYLTIAGDYDEVDNNYGTVRKIPIGMILKITPLKHEDPQG